MNRASVILTLLALCGIDVLVTLNSVTRLRQFTPDSMAYVDAARNLDAGHGLSSSIAGLNQSELPIEPAIPVPFTTYAPLYPIVIAGVARLGFDAADAALLVAAACWLLVLVFGYALARRTGGEPAALLAVAILLVYAPLRMAGITAWSEPLALVFVLSSLLALPSSNARAPSAGRAALAGLFAGLAFASRYALVPLVLVGPLVLLARSQGRAVRAALVFTGAALVPVLAVVLRNRALEGAVLPSGPASSSGFFTIAADAVRVLTGMIVARWGFPREAIVLGGLVAGAVLAAWRREGSPLPTLRSAWAGHAFTVLAFALSYVLFLVVVRSRRNFDPIDMRLVLPAGVALVLVVSGMLVRGFRVGRRGALVALALAAAFVGVREVRNLRRDPPLTPAAVIAASERLSWIADSTSARDLVIGDNAMDVSFHTRRHAISFSPWPFTGYPTEERIRAWAAAHRGEHDRYFIVLSRRYERVEDWEKNFGPWFARLASGRDTVDAGLGAPRRLKDAIVYPYDPFAS